MPLTQIRVNPPSNVSARDGDAFDALGGKATEAIVAELHGKYYTQAYRGNCFMVSTVAAGLAHPILSTTAPVVMLWNPLGSGKNAVLLRYCSACTLNATCVAGSVLLMGIFGAGSVIATGSAITAFNQSVLGTNLFNLSLGSGNVSVMKSSANGTNTVTAVTAVVAVMGQNLPTTAAGAVASPTSIPGIVYDFDGTVIVTPGVAVFVAASAASSALSTQSLLWEEVPI